MWRNGKKRPPRAKDQVPQTSREQLARGLIIAAVECAHAERLAILLSPGSNNSAKAWHRLDDRRPLRPYA